MKKNAMKTVGLISAIVMACSGLSACGGTATPASTKVTPAADGGTATVKPEADAEKPYEVSILSITYTGEPIPDNGANKLYMEEYTNSKINFTWVADSNYEDKLNVMMAGNSLPTLVVLKGLTSSVINNARVGAFWDVTDELQKYPNLSGTNDIVLSNVSIDGRVYGVPRQRVLGRNGITYRKDWLANVGLEEPKTVDDLYEVLKAFTFNDPDGNGIDDTYGMTWCKWYGPLDIIATWYGAGNAWTVEKDGSVAPHFTSEAYMESMKFAKKLYDEGLVNEDFAVRDSAIWSDDFKAGKSGVHIDVADQAQRNQDELTKLGFPDTVWVIGSVEGPGGLKNLPTAGHAGIVAVTKNGAKTEADLAKALTFIDKTNDVIMTDLFNFGIVDKDYTIVDGKVTRMADFDATAFGKANEGFNQFMTNILDNGTLEATDAVRTQVAYVQKVFNPPLCVANPCAPLLSSSKVYTEKGSTLDTMWQDARIQFIVGQIDEAGYEAAIDAWRAQGGNDLITELSDMHKISRQ